MELTTIFNSIKKTEKLIEKQKTYVNSLRLELDIAKADLVGLEHTLEFYIKAINEARQEQIQQQLNNAVDISKFKLDKEYRKSILGEQG